MIELSFLARALALSPLMTVLGDEGEHEDAMSATVRALAVLIPTKSSLHVVVESFEIVRNAASR